MVKFNGLLITGIILFVLVEIFIFGPHIAFLAELIPTLDIISHSVLLITAGLMNIIAVILIVLGIMKKR